MKVLVAMSGGVDSAVSAHLIKQEHEALGVTMKLHDETDNLIYGENSCCSNQDIADAKSVCNLVGIPHEVHDFGASFKECVIKDFIDCYYNEAKELLEEAGFNTKWVLTANGFKEVRL